MTSAHDDEIDRVRAEYARRRREIPHDFYALSRSSNLFFRHGQERALREGLDRAGMLPLDDRDVLEVGCGEGQWLETFCKFGVRRDRLAGIDLDPTSVEACRPRFPGADLRVGDAGALPWPDDSFDVVFQSTVFTSILDPTAKQRLASEMRRVLRPGGTVAWYDFVYDNPKNSQVKGVKEKEIRALFPGSTATFRRVTLAPPLARRLVPRSWLFADVLERLKVLNTHCLAVLRWE